MGTGLVGDHVRAHTALDQFRQDLGRVTQQRDGNGFAFFRVFGDTGQRVVEVGGLLIDITAGQAEIDADLLALDVQRARAGQCRGQRLCAAHAAETGGEDPTAFQIAVVMLATGFNEGFVGALDDALAADVDPAAGSHLAVHSQALGIQFVEVFPTGPVRNQVGVGDQHARGVAMGLEHADRFAGLHQQGFVVVQIGEALDDLVVALPITCGAANAAVHHQLFRVLGHLRVEVVHQHAQRCFSQPAFGGELVTAGGADFDVTVFCRLGHC